MVAVTVAIEGREHDAEGPGPLAEEDEEVVSQRLLGEEETPVVDCRGEAKEGQGRSNRGETSTLKRSV